MRDRVTGFARSHPDAVAVVLVMILKLSVAGVGMYAFLRLLTVPTLASATRPA